MMSPTSRRLRGLALVATFSVAVLLAACGSDDGGASTDTTTQSPEDVRAPMDEVLAKLPDILTAADAAQTAAADGDFGAVLDEYDELHDVWEEVEGTVKDADPDIYERIETAQGLIKDGGETENAERVATGVADQADAIGAFIEGNS